LLAMALAGDPEVVILDEPISSLDASSRIEVLSFLEDALAGRAVLVVTHDLSTAARLCRKTATLYAGRIVELGPTEKVLSEPRHPYTRALVRSYPEMITGKDLQGIKGQMNRRTTGCPFHPRCTQQIPLCREQPPPLTAHNGRLVACHRGGIIPALAVEKISKRFGPLKAVDKASLTVQHGETLALIGQSGSGKTTLARIIIGILKPDSGEVYLEMERVGKLEKDFHRAVQMVFQNPGEALSHRLTVLESVMEPLDIQGIGTREERVLRAKMVIGEVELPVADDFLSEYPHHLSGGELQRVNIARALVLDPKVLIADEPTSFLDPGLQAKVLKLLLNLQERRGLAMIFITHDIAVARKVSDRIAVMLEGRIVEEGPASHVIAHPSHSYTKGLIEAASGTSAGSEQGQPVLGEVLNELPELRGRNNRRGCL
ncbi:MAG: ABC transporter ATP-binding protein, partial [Deltaproteobacteria bacterium]|nr:ABC transporter ATP-binding protein [Deltaproteobacteria bacterium]